MNASIDVRPFTGQDEYEQMVDYFLGADDVLLRGMGVDRAKFPSRQDWLASALVDHQRPNTETEHGYFDFALRRLYCEPYADNPGPNRVLRRSDFRLVKRYRTVPGPLNFEQDVNQYVRDFPPSTAV